MKSRILVTALALAALPRIAHADANAAGSSLGNYAQYIGWMQEYGTAIDARDESVTHDPKDCFAAIEKNSGDTNADDKIEAGGFKSVPGAVKLFNGRYQVPFSKGKWICQTYRDLRATILAVHPLEAIVGELEDTQIREDSFEALDWYLIATGQQKVEGGAYQARADQCTAAIDQAIADGAKPDVKVLYKKKYDLTLDELRAKCQAQTDQGGDYAAKVNAWAKEKYETVKAKYTAVGIKGKRLDLFIYNDGGEWYLPGCTKSTADPKALKKAKKLFAWLTAPNGTITIRKYVFKGDKYKLTEKQYDLDAKAYKGCR